MTVRRYPVHAAARLMPGMTAEAFAAFKADIKKHGQRKPIVLHRGKVLDGVHRLRACRELGLEPKTVEWDGHGDPAAYVVSSNAHRRHLSQSQRAMLAVTVLPGFAEQAKERQRAGGRNKAEAVYDYQHATLSEPGKASQKAAAQFNVSPRYVEMAKALRAAAPALARDVLAGKLSLGEANSKMEQRRLRNLTTPQHIKDRLAAEGATPEGRRRIFQRAIIRQITLSYGWEEHRSIIARLERVLKQTKTKNPSEALPQLLALWERHHKKR